MSEEEQLTLEEREELSKLMGGNAPVPDEKHNVHTFISKVMTTNDTTKVGNLNEDEIGMLKNPVRSYKTISLFVKSVMHNAAMANYFNQEAEIATSTSLSRKAALLKFATTTSRTIADLSKSVEAKSNSGWFGKKDKDKGQ